MRGWWLALAFCVACGPSTLATTRLHETGGGDPPQPETRSARGVAAELVRLLNRERRRAGLHALKRHGKLDQAARTHSQDMANHQFVGHHSPSTGTPAQRVQRTGAVATVVRENVAMAYSTRELHDGWMDSRGHRENILSPEVRQVGIAVVPRQEGNLRLLFATQVFAKIAPRLTVSTAPRKALRKLQVLRKQAGVAKLREPAGLRKAAARIARLLGKTRAGKRDGRLQRELSGVSLPRGARSLSAALVTLIDIDQLEDTRLLLSRKVGWIGIGAFRPKRGEPDLALVCLIAR